MPKCSRPIKFTDLKMENLPHLGIEAGCFAPFDPRLWTIDQMQLKCMTTLQRYICQRQMINATMNQNQISFFTRQRNKTSFSDTFLLPLFVFILSVILSSVLCHFYFPACPLPMDNSMFQHQLNFQKPFAPHLVSPARTILYSA